MLTEVNTAPFDFHQNLVGFRSGSIDFNERDHFGPTNLEELDCLSLLGNIDRRHRGCESARCEIDRILRVEEVDRVRNLLRSTKFAAYMLQNIQRRRNLCSTMSSRPAYNELSDGASTGESCLIFTLTNQRIVIFTYTEPVDYRCRGRKKSVPHDMSRQSMILLLKMTPDRCTGLRSATAR